MSLLLDLHKNYCGEDFLCKNDSSYWEPSAHEIPVPCCVPCSCLPTCGGQLDCCPAFWKNQTTDDTEDGERTPPKERNSNPRDISDDVIARDENSIHVDPHADTGLSNFISKSDCIRPQALYELNSRLDSEAYEMVTTCSEQFRDMTIIEKCHAGMDKKILLEIIPVTSSLTGLTYSNKYCLEYNGAKINDASDVYEWQPVLVGHSLNLSL